MCAKGLRDDFRNKIQRDECNVRLESIALGLAAAPLYSIPANWVKMDGQKAAPVL